MDDAGVRRGLFRCALAALLFGATTPLAARLAARTDAPILAGLLYVGAALGVAPFALRRRVDRRAMRRGIRPLGIAVGFGGLLGPLLLAAGLARLAGATASLLLNLELVATTVFAVVLFHEHIGRRVAIGTVAVATAGAVLAWSNAAGARLGAIFIVGACACWGLDNCITANLDQVAPEHITVAKGVVAGATNLALALVLGMSAPGYGLATTALALGAVGYGASITLWVAGARELGAARGQLVFAAAPFVGVGVAWLVLREPVRPAELVALIIAAGGVSLVYGSDHLHEHRHDELRHDHLHDHADGHHRHPHPSAPTGDAHAHPHDHRVLVHAHPHMPDIHHRHVHDR